MLMAVLAIEWSLLVHGFLHLHYDVCDLDNQTLSFSQEQNISSSHQHVEERHDLGPDFLESIRKDNLDNFPEKNISKDNCNPSWPWININLHRLELMRLISWVADVTADYHNNVDDADGINDLKNAVEDIFEDDEEVDNAKLALHSMIAADFATFAVLVSFGVLLGKYILINITFMHHTQKPLPIYQLLIQFIIICLCISLNIKS